MAGGNEKVVNLVIRARDEGTKTLENVKRKLIEVSQVKTENRILGMTNQIKGLEKSLESLGAEAASYANAMRNANTATREGVDAARQAAIKSVETRAKYQQMKQTLRETTAALHQLKSGAQGSFLGFSKGASALDVTTNKLERLQKELRDTEAAYEQSTAAAQKHATAMKTQVGTGVPLGNGMVDSRFLPAREQAGLDGAVGSAREAKVRLAELRAEIARTNGEAKGSFLAFSRAADAMEIQTTEALGLAPAVQQVVTKTTAATSGQNNLARSTDRATAAMKRQRAAAAGGAMGGDGPDIFDEATAAYATRQGRGPLGLRPYELTNLSYQINDVVSGIAMGQAPVQIFAQQFGQFSQLFPEAQAAILRFLPVLAALAPVFAGLAREAREAESVRIFAAQLALSADGARYSAQELAGVTAAIQKYSANVDEARKITSLFVKEGISADKMAPMAQMADRLAKIIGGTAEEAAQKLVTAFNGNVDSVRELDKELNFLSASQLANIRAMEEAGNKTGALSEAQRILSERLAQSVQPASTWEQALKDLKAAWDALVEALIEIGVIDAAAAALGALAMTARGAAKILKETAEFFNPPEMTLAEQYGAARKQLETLKAQAARLGVTEGDTSPFGQALLAELAEAQAAYDAIVLKIKEAQEAQAAQRDAAGQTTAETEEQKKASDDVDRIIADILEKREKEYDLASLTAKEQFIEQGILEAINAAKAEGNELDAQQLALLRQRLGLLYEEKGLRSAGEYEREFSERRFSGAGKNDAELVAAAVEVARRLGVDAKDILTAISYETAGTMDPWKAGPVTKWGQHRGLIQWGEPQRAQYGVTESSTITEQMEAVGRYLADAGVKAGDGLLQIYAAINAGNAANINASDQRNGGAPGTVLDKVNGQMAGHEARAEGMLAAYAGVTEEVENRLDAEERSAELLDDMNFELSQAQKSARDAAIAEAVRNQEKARGVALSQEERAQVEATAAALWDAQNASRLIDQNISNLVAKQQLLQSQITAALASGDTGQANLLQQQLAAVNKELDLAIEKAIAFYQAMGGPEAEAAILKLQQLKLDTQQMGVQIGITAEDINRGLAEVGVSAFRSLAQAIAEGTNAWVAFRDAALQALANVILKIGEAIVEAAILNAITGGMGGGGGIGGTVMGWIGSIFHEGGVVGSPAPSRTVSPAAFAGAIRYHSGGIAGLKPNEVPAILERGEEVIPADDPRHVNNGGASGDPSRVTVVNAFDATSFLDEGLKKSDGRSVMLNFVRANSAALRQAMGIRS